MDTVNASRHVEVERQVVVSSQPFERVMARLDAAVGSPDMRAFARDVAAATTAGELARVVHNALGVSGLMEIARVDAGQLLRKRTGTDAPKIVRLILGNPLVLKEIVEQVRDAASYAPITILVDERPDGVYLSYDTLASVLSPYGNAEATKAAQALDARVAVLLAAVAV
jgi:uncharacterized protein (DUF302 family)